MEGEVEYGDNIKRDTTEYYNEVWSRLVPKIRDWFIKNDWQYYDQQLELFQQRRYISTWIDETRRYFITTELTHVWEEMLQECGLI